MNVLVTGASGFVGTALVPALASRGYAVRPAVRVAPPHTAAIAVGDIGPDTDWRPALDGCDAVVHLAARVHVMRDEISSLHRPPFARGKSRGLPSGEGRCPHHAGLLWLA